VISIGELAVTFFSQFKPLEKWANIVKCTLFT